VTAEERKQVWISRAHNESLEKLRAGAALRQKPVGGSGGGCGLVEIQGPGGVRFECGGSCGFINRFLGRSCTKVSRTTDAGVEIFCTCSGGWFDGLLGR